MGVTLFPSLSFHYCFLWSQTSMCGIHQLNNHLPLSSQVI